MPKYQLDKNGKCLERECFFKTKNGYCFLVGELEYNRKKEKGKKKGRKNGGLKIKIK